MLDWFLWDLRFALRWMRRSPAFTLLATLSLAIGIGFNTALFSVVDALLLRPVPGRDPAQLVDVCTSGSDGDPYATSSYPDYLDLAAGNSVFQEMAGHSAMFAALNLGDRSRLALGEVVTGNYFHLLGVAAEKGRTLLPADDRAGADRVVVVSHRYWQRELGSDPDVLGRTVRLRGQPYAVVGVLPPSFTGMLPVLASEIWVPVAQVSEVEPAGIQDSVPSPTGTSRIDRRGQRWLFIKGRLRPGVTSEQARANLEVLMRRLAAAHPQTNKDRHIAVARTSGVRIHPGADRVLVPLAAGLMAVVGLVLLIACANVARMLLARAASRRREIGIRLAIGASRGRLVRQLLTESVTLAAIGAAAGTAIAWWLTRLVATLSLPIPIPLTLDLRIDGRVLAFTVAVTLVAGLVAGLAPAFAASGPGLSGELRGGAPLARVAGRRWSLRDGLVALQIAVTMVLVVCAALLARSLMNARQADVGFRAAGLAIVSLDLDMVRYDQARATQFFDRAMERISRLPGVESVARAERLPFSINFNQQELFIPGYQKPGDRTLTIQVTRVSPDYFRTLGVSILQGRGFSAADTPESPGVAIVNETFARRFFPGESALGKVVHQRGPEGPAFQIVGVSADHKVMTVGEAPEPYVQFSTTQRPSPYGALVARTRLDAGALVGQMERELLAMEPNLVLVDQQTMDAQVAATLLPIRATAWIVAVVGVVGLFLATAGLYGTIAYSVSRRTREIGIRMALGAQASAVVGLVLRQGLGVAVAGVAVGAGLAALAAQALRSLLYGVTLADPVAWGASALAVFGAALVANLAPVRRAVRVDPSSALRAE